MSTLTVVDLDEIEPAGPGNAVRFLRRALGVTAFGINHVQLPPNFEGPAHDEIETGQEEVYVVLEGEGTITVGEESVELRPGRCVRVDPLMHRAVSAGPSGLTLIAIGAVPGSYEPHGPF